MVITFERRTLKFAAAIRVRRGHSLGKKQDFLKKPTGKTQPQAKLKGLHKKSSINKIITISP